MQRLILQVLHIKHIIRSDEKVYTSKTAHSRKTQTYSEVNCLNVNGCFLTTLSKLLSAVVAALSEVDILEKKGNLRYFVTVMKYWQPDSC